MNPTNPNPINGWLEFFDPKHQRHYYVNVNKNPPVTQWTVPKEFLVARHKNNNRVEETSNTTRGVSAVNMNSGSSPLLRGNSPSLLHDSYVAIGIDLGTTSSVCAICDTVKNQVPQVISCGTNSDATGQMRSVVGYRSGGVRIIGDTALDDFDELQKGNTFYLSKRLLARRFYSAAVRNTLSDAPFAKHAASSNPDDPNGTVVFNIVVDGHDSERIVPEQVSAAILSRLLSEAAEVYKDYSLVRPPVVVISVPANFNAAQRRATRDAARIAGLNHVQLINEPTAAAFGHRISYGSSPPERSIVMVYDLGGGTLDVSLVDMGYDKTEWIGLVRSELETKCAYSISVQEMDEICSALEGEGQDSQRKAELRAQQLLGNLPRRHTHVNVLACEGDVNLGGADFDRALAGYLKEQLSQRIKSKYVGISSKMIDALIFDQTFHLQLLMKCEEAKRKLSVQKKSRILLEVSKLQGRDSAPPPPPPEQLSRLYGKSTHMKKFCRVSKPHGGKIKIVDGMLVWKSTGAFSSFRPTKRRKVALSDIHRVTDGSDSPVFKRHERLLGEDRRSLSIWYVAKDNQDSSDEDTDAATLKSLNIVMNNQEDWRCWLSGLRHLSKHYDQASMNNGQGRHIFEIAADSEVDVEAFTVTQSQFEDAASTFLASNYVNLNSKLGDGTEYGRKNDPAWNHGTLGLWDRCKLPIANALQSAGLSVGDVDEVLFVGGSTCMPKVRRIVRSFFKDSPRTKFRSDARVSGPITAVAIGAAFYGGLFAGDVGEPTGGTDISAASNEDLKSRLETFDGTYGVTLSDITPKSVGLKVRLNSRETVHLEIYEGESEKSEDTENTRKIGDFSIDLTKVKWSSKDARDLEIRVSFIVDNFGVLTVEADVSECGRPTGTRQTLHIRLAEDLVLTDRQVEEMRREELMYLAREQEAAKSRGMESKVSWTQLSDSIDERSLGRTGSGSSKASAAAFDGDFDFNELPIDEFTSASHVDDGSPSPYDTNETAEGLGSAGSGKQMGFAFSGYGALEASKSMKKCK
eukprot:g3412.t1